MKIRYIAVTTIAVWFGVFSIGAQSADLIDTVLAEERLTYGNAAYVLLLGSGEIDENLSIADAHRTMEERAAALGYEADAPLTLGEYSLLAMDAFDIPGGVVYSIVPSPRYAARSGSPCLAACPRSSGRSADGACPRLRSSGSVAP